MGLCIPHSSTIYPEIIYFSAVGQVIQIATILMESNTDMEDYQTLVSAFSMLKTCVGSWHFSKAFCGNPVVVRAFHEVFDIEVLPSFYDYIHVSKINQFKSMQI